MDRRQRKSREAIFTAFTALLSQKDFSRITVEEIIEKADVSRSTFYAHFETKEYLLKELCGELFCHVFDVVDNHPDHRHIFQCDEEAPVFTHLFRHLMKNDHNILQLLSGQNNELFLQYFRAGLETVAVRQLSQFAHRKPPQLPESFWVDHIASTFVETLRWWIRNGMQESPETITEYFFLAV